LFTLFSFVHAAPGQAPRISFERIGFQQGLSQRSVLCIFEDSLGFIWIGTMDGLNRYDGYAFKTFLYDPLAADSISDSSVLSICEDREGYLWIGTTSGGLNRFDRRTEKFTSFKHDPDDSGTMSDNLVNAVWEDSHGRLWAGTSRGLDLVDRETGKVKRYGHDPDDPSSLSANSVLTIFEDRSGQLWIGTAEWSKNWGGLDRYDAQTDSFLHCKLGDAPDGNLGYGPILSIMEDLAGNLWITTYGDGVYQLAPDRATMSHYAQEYPAYVDELWQLADQLGASGQTLASLLQPGNDRHLETSFTLDEPADVLILAQGEALLGMLFDYGWIADKLTGKAVWQMNAKRTLGGGGHYKNVAQISALNLPAGQYEVHFKSDGSHSYGKWNTRPPDRPESWGIQVLRLPDGAAAETAVLLDKKQIKSPNYIASNTVSSAVEDGEGFIWFALRQERDERALARFDPRTGEFIHYVSNPADPTSLSSRILTKLLIDRAGNLWVGTWFDGLNKYSWPRARFHHFVHQEDDDTTLSAQTVTCFCEDSHGDIWVGTQGGGINRFLRESGAFERIDTYVSITGMAEDPGGFLWMSAPGPGLLRMDLRTKETVFRDYTASIDTPEGLSNPAVTALLVDATGALWVGTKNGLNKFVEDTESFEKYLPEPKRRGALGHPEVSALCEGDAGQLWVGTEGGLNLLDTKREKFTVFRHIPGDRDSLSHDRISALFRSSDGTLWIGTQGGGLNRFDAKHQEFTWFTMHDGLPSNVIMGIAQDADGRLWLSTNHGLSRFDPDSRTAVNFDVSDGLQCNEFLIGSCLQAKDGQLFFGGTNGFNAFYPHEIAPNPHVPPVVITEIRTLDRVLARDTISAASHRLGYNQNSLTFEFVALDYANPRRNQYMYRLMGYDQEWTMTSNRRYVGYTNLSPGDYTFQVRGANSDGLWNQNAVSVNVTITPPPWRTSGAYLLYLALIAAAITFLVKSQTRRERQKAALREAELRAQAAHSQAEVAAAQTRAIEADNQRKTDELERARMLQLSMLPAMPMLLANLELAVFMRTATEVGGDYYDYIPQADGSLLLITGDATGHGLPAGMMVSMTKAALHSVRPSAPNLVLEQLNRGIKHTSPSPLKMALNVLHLQREEIIFSSAGMPPIYIFRAASGSIDELLLPALPLGSLDEISYPLERVPFYPGDVLVLISDGLPEWRNAAEAPLGYDAVRDCMRQHGREPVQKIVDHLVVLGETWSGGNPHDDDITLLVVRRLS